VIVGVTDTWYAEPLGIAHIDDIAGGRLGRILAKRAWGRGVLFWLLGRRGRYVVTTLAGLPRSFLMLERLFPRRSPYVVLLEFIPVLGSEAQTLWGAPGGRTRRLLSRLQWRGLVVPPLRRSLLMAQCLTEWEVTRSARELGLPEDQFRFVPWFKCSEIQTKPSAGRAGVVSSGRAACDWETVFAAARGRDWALTVICGSGDLDRVTHLNRDDRARVLCEITPEQHAEEVAGCLVYLLALREAEVSSGQVRLSEAWDAGALIVASEVKGLQGYLDSGRNCLTFEPGDDRGASEAVAALIEDESLRSNLRQTTSADIARWTRSDYLRTLRSHIEEAVGPQSDAPSSSSVAGTSAASERGRESR
jgi:hypothetical protein